MKILILNGSPRPNGNTAANYLHLDDMGIFTAYGKENKSEEKLAELREAGRKLQ